MAVQSRFRNARVERLQRAMTERFDPTLNDPTASEDHKAMRRQHLASSEIAARASRETWNDRPGQAVLRDAVADGGDSDDALVARVEFNQNIPNWANTYGRNRTNP